MRLSRLRHGLGAEHDDYGFRALRDLVSALRADHVGRTCGSGRQRAVNKLLLRRGADLSPLLGREAAPNCKELAILNGAFPGDQDGSVVTQMSSNVVGIGRRTGGAREGRRRNSSGGVNRVGVSRRLGLGLDCSETDGSIFLEVLQGRVRRNGCAFRRRTSRVLGKNCPI